MLGWASIDYCCCSYFWRIMCVSTSGKILCDYTSAKREATETVEWLETVVSDTSTVQVDG